MSYAALAHTGTYQARLAAIRAEHATTDRSHPDHGEQWRDARRRAYVWELLDAMDQLGAAHLDDDELRYLDWLAGWDDETVAGVCALLDRARLAGEAAVGARVPHGVKLTDGEVAAW